MRKHKPRKSERRTEFGRMLEQGLREVLAHQRGEIALETIDYSEVPIKRTKMKLKRADWPLQTAVKA